MKDKFREIRIKYNKLKETILNELQLNDLNSENEIDEFEQINTIQRICDEINWNIINNSTVYILTTSLISNKIICSLNNNIESNLEYKHICEYGKK